MAGIPDTEQQQQQHLFAAAHHMVRALEAADNLSDDLRRLLADLNVHLSTIIGRNDEESENIREIENQLISAQQTITSLHSRHSKMWSPSPATLLEYLQAVDEAQRSTARLETTPSNRSTKRKELLDRAQSILQLAMARVQKELIDILAQNKQCFGHGSIPLPACGENPISDESFVSNEDDSVDNASQRESSFTETEEYVMDLVHPDMIPLIKSIANTMFASGYDIEFCQVFVGFWRCTFAEHLTSLDVGRFSIEDVLKMEWKWLNSRIRKWHRAMKIIISVYLASAKQLFDRVLGEYGCISSTCLIDASKAALLGLFNFGQAVAIGPHGPEWLFCILDMYEVLVSLIPDVDALFPEESGSAIRDEFDDLLTRLGDSAKTIIKGLGNHIASDSTTTAFAIGGIHPLTKYVMNYALSFADYGDTLNLLLQVRDWEDSARGQSGRYLSCPVALHLQSSISTLEANLANKANNLFKDRSLQHIFMMNNIHYMVQKIENSSIRPYFGDEWIRNHIVEFRKHARCYERVTWSSIIDLFHEDGKVGKKALKARCHDFTAAFEDVYKNQTRWCVPDLKLREEVRISASKAVIIPYRNFVSKVTDSIGEKHIKYTEQDLEAYILDLLEGSSKSLSHSRKW